MSARLMLAALLSLGTAATALADPIGHFKMEGTSPDGAAKYSGTVDLTKTGDTYEITWTVDGGDKFVGTAIGDDSFLSSAYRSGEKTGIALYSKKGNDWEGIWTYAGGQKIGFEKWTPE